MLEITLVGGPTAATGYGGLRWLTDPSASSQHYTAVARPCWTTGRRRLVPCVSAEDA